MQQPTQSEYNNIYEIRFKNTRKAFFRNSNGLHLITGDLVVVESDRGFDVGQISLGGILAKLQMKKRKVDERSDRIRKIFRRATQEDIEKAKTARSREQDTMVQTRVIIRDLGLEMKLSDVEFQGDNTKAIFYYIADQRVDFRQLIKILAERFKIRVEMKQIGLRHEAGLVGGIGSCGRELCCSTWLTDFKSVSTAAARFQNLSLNPMKISGQCGRLKCCLNYELETYLDALQDIPKVNKIQTELGEAYLQKTDIFKRIMWFSYKNETSWVPLEVEKVVLMAEMNAKGETPASLHSLDEPAEDTAASVDFVDVVGQAELRLDKPRRRKKGGGRGKGRGRNSQNAQGKGRQQRSGSKQGGGGNRNQQGGANPEAKTGGKSEGNREGNRNRGGSGRKGRSGNRKNTRGSQQGQQQGGGNQQKGNQNPSAKNSRGGQKGNQSQRGGQGKSGGNKGRNSRRNSGNRPKGQGGNNSGGNKPE